jgi:hypothetical protein
VYSYFNKYLLNLFDIYRKTKMMNNFVKQTIEEEFKSKAQQRLFFAKAKNSKKWREWANEFADDTDFDKLPERKKKKKKKKSSEEQMKLSNTVHNGNSEGEVDEIVDADGNIQTGDLPGNPNEYIRSKKTSDQVAKASMGQMGSFGVLGGATGANKTLKYWAESDMSKALGADETIADPNVDYEDAVDKFEDELEVPEDEAKERAKQMGYDPELDEVGKMRLIENPKAYIEEYLSRRAKQRELVRKQANEKKEISPIVKRQLNSLKSSLKSNGLRMADITEYLEDE